MGRRGTFARDLLRVALVAAPLAGAGCGGSEPANLVKKTIGPDGDIITSHDGVLTIVILPGALEKPTDVEVFPSDEPPRIYGPAYRVRPDIELAVDAEVTYRRVLPTDPEAAAVGAIHLADYTDGEGHWSALSRLSLDVGDDSITATDAELSLYYGLLEQGGGPSPGTGSGTGDGSTGEATTIPVTAEGTASTTGPDPTDATASTSTTDPTDPSTTTGTTDPTDASTTTGTTDPGTGSTTDGGMMFVCSDGTAAPGELCYVAGSDFAVGAGPSDLVLGDFDGDTELDVVTSNRTAGDITIVLGAGDGSFGAPASFAVGTSPGAIAMGDFDDDMELDVAVVNTDDDTVGLLRGVGDGTFMAQMTFAVGDAPTDLSTSSYGVGPAADVVVVNSGDATIQILTGGAGGVMTPSAPFAVLPAAATCVVGGEFNSNMLSDAFAFGAGGAFHGWSGDGAGSFSAGQEISGNYGGSFVRCDAADIDGNGTGDIALVDTSNDSVQVRSGTGTAQFNLISTTGVGANPSDVALGDLASNGLHAAVVTGRDADDVTIVRQLPGEVWMFELSLPVGTSPSGVKIGEVTGDGVLDIVVCNEGADTITVIASDP